MNLQHLALAKFSKTHPYPKGNPIINNLIYEIQKMKDQLDVDIEAQEAAINRSLPDPVVDLDDYFGITCEIHEVLFSDFSYKTDIKTDEHIQWKEYFNCLYDHCVIDYDSEQFFHFTLSGFTLFDPPEPLEPGDICYGTVQTLRELFDKLHTEHRRVVSLLKSPSEYMKFRLSKGRSHLDMITRRDHLVRRRNSLVEIIKWSM